MSKHQGIIQSINENQNEQGQALLMTVSTERMGFVGTCDTPDLVDFLETLFRASPGLKAIFDEASERAEWPVS